MNEAIILMLGPDDSEQCAGDESKAICFRHPILQETAQVSAGSDIECNCRACIARWELFDYVEF